jgi:uncharacterized protein (DUF952 family)
LIYHIAPKTVIKGILSTGFYKPKGFIKEGFIHCSTKEQVIPVANRFYSDQNNLILIEIEDKKLAANVVYENLEGGSELFPHIYTQIPLSAIAGIAALNKDKKGYSFPQSWSLIDNNLNMVK